MAVGIASSNLSTLAAGLPSYESNTLYLPWAVQGQSWPGIYDQLRTQVPIIARLLREAEDAYANLGVQWVPCKDATPDEIRFNSALIEMCRDRLHVKRADFDRIGLRHFLAMMPQVEYYGFGLFDTALSGSDVYDKTARLEVKEILRSSVLRFDWSDYSAQFPTSVLIRTAFGIDPYPYDNFIHIARGGVVGLVLGEAAARPLIAPAMTWRQLMLALAAYAQKATGIVVIDSGPESGADTGSDEDKVRFEQTKASAAAMSEGRLLYYLAVTGQRVELLYPTGTPPDFKSLMQDQERMIKEALGSRLATMTTSESNAPGVAKEFSEEDRKARTNMLTVQVNDAWQALARFVARRSDYTGRIFEAELAGDEQESTARWLQVITDAKREGILDSLTAEDEAAIRERLRLPPQRPVEITAPSLENVARAFEIEASANLSIADRNFIRKLVGIPEIQESQIPAVPYTPPIAPEVSIG